MFCLGLYACALVFTSLHHCYHRVISILHRAHMLGGGPSREQLEEAIALFGEGFEDLGKILVCIKW